MGTGYTLGARAAAQIAKLIRESKSVEQLHTRKPVRRQQRVSVVSTGVMVVNYGTEDIPPFGIMRITGTTTVGDQSVVTVDKMSTEFQRFTLVNGAATIYADAEDGSIFGTGYRCERPVLALYDSADGTPAIGQIWGPRSGSWKLRRHHYGYRIEETVNSGTQDFFATTVMVTQHLVDHVKGKTDGAYAKAGTSGIVSVWEGDNSADTTMNVTSVNTPYLNIASGAWCRVGWNAETPEITAGECP